MSLLARIGIGGRVALSARHTLSHSRAFSNLPTRLSQIAVDKSGQQLQLARLEKLSRLCTTAANHILDSIVNARGLRSLDRKGRPVTGKPTKGSRATRPPAEKEEQNEESSSSGDGDKQREKRDPDDDRRKELLDKMKRIFAVSLFVYGVLFMLSPGSDGPPGVVKTDWSTFVNKLLPTGQIQRIIVFPEKEQAFVYMYAGAKTFSGEQLESLYRIGIPSLPRFEAEVRAAEAAINLPPEMWTHIEYRRMDGVSGWLNLALLSLIVLGVYMLFRKAKGFNMSDMMSNMTKTKYNIIDPHSPEGKSKLKIKFKDVAGLHEAKVEISEFVDYLKNPTRYTRLGAKLPKGALLTGPPGCGKTLLAKALAAESTAPFISMNGSEFVEMIGGLGASRIRGLFKEAKARAPCIVYIDEIDAIGRKRSEGKGAGMGGGSNEEEQTLNQLLVEMDGMGTAHSIVVLASTNRPDILDKALMRRGRFDRHVTVDLPTVLERQEMFELYLKRIKLDHPVTKYSQRLSQMTPGFSGADIANVVNEAAIRAAAVGKKVVSVEHLDHAMDRVLAGAEKRSRTLVAEEREVVAYHEAGHALVGWMLEHTDALLKVTIIPRTSAALGFAQYSPKDKKLFNKEELFDRMCMMLGGRVAESIKFNRVTTGAEDDLKKVTRSAYAQVRMYGMNSTVGPLSFTDVADFQKKPYSQRMAGVMDQEAGSLVGRAHQATDVLIRDNMDKLELIAQALLKREVLNYEDVKALIGSPRFGEKNVVELVDTILPQEEK